MDAGREHDDHLHAAARRNAGLDRELAGDLGRPAPAPSAAQPGYIGRLEGRARLGAAAERDLIERARGGDAEARAQLVEWFLPRIAGLARSYRTAGNVQRPELLQEGVVGLLRALERFDPGRGVPFWAYASWWVRQAMQQLVAELTRPTVLSDRALRNLAQLKDAHQEALREGIATADRDELARRSGLSPDQVDELLAIDRPPRSLDEPLVGDEGAIGTFGELVSDPLAEDEYERVLDAIESDELLGLLAGLSDRERAILRARYGLDGEEQSLRDVASSLGLSAERIRQLERRALGKLASAAGVEHDDRS